MKNCLLFVSCLPDTGIPIGSPNEGDRYETTGKSGLDTPIAFLTFSTFYLASGLLHAATPCDIETEQVFYLNGETVRLSGMRLTNSDPVAQFYEWKLWFKSP